MTPLNFHLTRSLVINAPPETVFRYFTDSARFAKWWGPGSTIDASIGGKVAIRHPGGVEVAGEVLEITPPEKIVFTYGYVSGKPIPAGSSRVTITLKNVAGATELNLLHELADEPTRNDHVQGWRFQLSVFANVVADEVFAAANTIADTWFDAWAITDPATRDQAFETITTQDVTFQDRYSTLQGPTEISLHAGAAQRFMPGMRLQRNGNVRQCQGTVLADWVVRTPDGTQVMSGTNVFSLAPDGRIKAATGLANPMPPPA
jgi:uncharacterized protein YndB with AHSA1/START domain